MHGKEHDQKGSEAKVCSNVCCTERPLLMKLMQNLEDVMEAEELNYIGSTKHMVSTNP
jgi:hypothetical protein